MTLPLRFIDESLSVLPLIWRPIEINWLIRRPVQVLSLLSFWLNATTTREYVDLPTTESAARHLLH